LLRSVKLTGFFSRARGKLTNQVRDLRMAFALEEYGRLTGEITDATTRIAALTDRAAEASPPIERAAR